jgi:hypothetical protein
MPRYNKLKVNMICVGREGDFAGGNSAGSSQVAGLFIGDVTTGLSLQDTTTGLSLEGSTTAISFTGSGAMERAIDFNQTVGTTTDGVLMRAGTGIGTNGLEFGTASQRAFALYLRPTAATGTFTGMRLRSIADPSSGATLSINNLHIQTSVIASKDAATINSLFVEIVPKGTNTITTARGMLINLDSAASQTMTTQMVAHLRVHTRGDETITNDYMLYLENEAVGGNGRQLDSFIQMAETNMSGGTKAAAYMIDAGTSTSMFATALMRIPDDEVVAWDDAQGSGDTEAGAIKVVVGSATRYIQLYSDAPA